LRTSGARMLDTAHFPILKTTLTRSTTPERCDPFTAFGDDL
jgi:hypothetical protein